MSLATMNEVEHFFNCPYCGENISMLIDLNAGDQEYIEDCEVCCHPIELGFKVCGEMVSSWKVSRLD